MTPTPVPLFFVWTRARPGGPWLRDDSAAAPEAECRACRGHASAGASRVVLPELGLPPTPPPADG